MRVQDQHETMAFLADPASHGAPGPVEVFETHISAVFLVGDTAYKLKQAVHLPYADFSTPEIRLAACEKELALNRATTPELYLRVRRITRDPQGLCFDGTGPLVDAVLEMRRFDQEDLFDEMAQRGDLTDGMLRVLAAEIAAAHRTAEVADDPGGADNIAAVLDINRAGFAQSSLFDAEAVTTLDTAFCAALARHAPLLDARARAGCIRRCHGDLHLRNVCLFRGSPRLFDCIDFNDQLATVDVLYDLAFMVMDLWHRDLHFQANLLTNQYLDLSGQEDGFALMPFFTALRAAVRAHVTATHAETCTPGEAAELRVSARDYYDLALAMLQPRPARLIAIGGLSGSGKSTMAEALAPECGAPPGARLVESDRVRKAMFGVSADTCLPEKAYTADVSEAVYATVAERAQTLLRAGCVVLADAVYDRADRRSAIARAASETGVPFAGIWLEAAPGVLLHRVADREKGASDATQGVLNRQLARDPGRIDWVRVSTSGRLDETLSEIRKRIGRDA